MNTSATSRIKRSTIIVALTAMAAVITLACAHNQPEPENTDDVSISHVHQIVDHPLIRAYLLHIAESALNRTLHLNPPPHDSIHLDITPQDPETTPQLIRKLQPLTPYHRKLEDVPPGGPYNHEHRHVSGRFFIHQLPHIAALPNIRSIAETRVNGAIGGPSTAKVQELKPPDDDIVQSPSPKSPFHHHNILAIQREITPSVNMGGDSHSTQFALYEETIKAFPKPDHYQPRTTGPPVNKSHSGFVRDHPASPQHHLNHNTGTSLHHARKYKAADRQYLYAGKDNPLNVAQASLALSSDLRWDNALRRAQHALELTRHQDLQPTILGTVQYAVAYAYTGQSQHDAALLHYQKALEHKLEAKAHPNQAAAILFFISHVAKHSRASKPTVNAYYDLAEASYTALRFYSRVSSLQFDHPYRWDQPPPQLPPPPQLVNLKNPGLIAYVPDHSPQPHWRHEAWQLGLTNHQDIYATAQQHDNPNERLDQAISLHPAPRYLLHRATNLATAGYCEQAIQEATNITLSPNDDHETRRAQTPAHQIIGVCSLQMGNPKMAVEQLNQGLQHIHHYRASPAEAASTLLSIAHAEIALGQEPNAIETLTEALLLGPNEPALTLRAQLHLNSKNYGDAIYDATHAGHSLQNLSIINEACIRICPSHHASFIHDYRRGLIESESNRTQ